jgi:hypothetical protein
MPILLTDYEKHQAQRVLDCDQGSVEAALALFERHDPTTLAEAARLIETQGQLTAEAFDHLTQAFDRYWHLRDTPSN